MKTEDLYPYIVLYNSSGRSAEWYAPGGTWYQLSTWCNETFGRGEWEYFFDRFRFKTEQDKMVFLLRWEREQ